MFKLLLLIVLMFCFAAQISAQSNTPLLIGHVAHNQTQVAFTYAGKIWLVNKNGGASKRLTNTDNEETNPVFSPDGRWIARRHARLGGSGGGRRISAELRPPLPPRRACLRPCYRLLLSRVSWRCKQSIFRQATNWVHIRNL